MNSMQGSLVYSSLGSAPPVENTISPLKILIAAVAAVVGALFGLFLAGLGGAILGAFVFSAIAIAGTHLFLSRKGSLETQETCAALPTPDTILSPVTAEIQIVDSIPLVTQQRHAPPSVETVPSISPTEPTEVFDFANELAGLYLLPGQDTFIEDEVALGRYLPQLRTSLMRVLSSSECHNNEKKALKEHFEKKLMPIYDSLDSLFEHLDKFAGTRALAEKMRENLATYWRSAKPFRNNIPGDRERVRRMIQILM